MGQVEKSADALGCFALKHGAERLRSREANLRALFSDQHQLDAETLDGGINF